MKNIELKMAKCFAALRKGKRFPKDYRADIHKTT